MDLHTSRRDHAQSLRRRDGQFAEGHYTRTCGHANPVSLDQELPGWDIAFPDDLKTVSKDGTRIQDEHDGDLDRSGKLQWILTENPP